MYTKGNARKEGENITENLSVNHFSLKAGYYLSIRHVFKIFFFFFLGNMVMNLQAASDLPAGSKVDQRQ